METTVINNSLRKKTIEVPDYILRDLAVKAKTEGVSLKKYIENILINDVEDTDDEETYAYLSKTRPEGLIMLNDEEQAAFEKRYGL